jgi:hypothetical protein
MDSPADLAFFGVVERWFRSCRALATRNVGHRTRDDANIFVCEPMTELLPIQGRFASVHWEYFASFAHYQIATFAVCQFTGLNSRGRILAGEGLPPLA